MTVRLALLLASLVLVAGCFHGDDGGAPQPRSDASGDRATFAKIPDLYDELQPSVVAVLVEGDRGRGEGSGVVFDRRRVVTNNHVIEGGRRIEVGLASGERLDATIIARDARTDLAVLGVPRDLPPATFADELPRVGALAVAIGNPLGFESSVTAGIVSGIDRAIPSAGRTPALVNLVQTDAPISPGNSGGALVGGDGRIIGINVAYIPPVASAVAIGFAIPSPTVVDVVEELIRDGAVDHAYLGVQLGRLTPQVSRALGVPVETGAVIETVVEDAPAADAGLRPGDVIVEAAGERVEHVEDVLSVLRRTDPGDSLKLRTVRGSERRDVSVRVGQRPSG